ncbi:hypothetical protein STANM309S_06443 [Streptomyces tanashiensis]
MGVHVGAQDVREDRQGVARVGLLSADAVAVAVSGGGERVNREDSAAAGAQGRDQEAVAGLDGHRYRIVLGVAVLGQESQELVVTGRVVGDTSFGEQGAGFFASTRATSWCMLAQSMPQNTVKLSSRIRPFMQVTST